MDRTRETPWVIVRETTFDDSVIERTTPHGSNVTGVRVLSRTEWEQRERGRKEAEIALRRISRQQCKCG